MLLLLALRSPTDRSIQGFWIFIYFEYLNEDNMYKGNKVAIGVPCYNEAVALPKVLEDITKYFPEGEVYVFDNNSTDDTFQVAENYFSSSKQILRTEGYGLLIGGVFKVKAKGKGNVVTQFFSIIEADIYVIVDGDATYDIASLRSMIDILLQKRLDMVVGRRVEIDSDPGNKVYRKGHRFGNKVITSAIAYVFDQKSSKRIFRDMLSGFRVFSRRYVKSFPSLSQGFEIETQLNVHALQLKMRCEEIPTPYYKRPDGSESKLSTYKDGVRIAWTIFKIYATEKPLFFYSVLAIFFGFLSIILAVPILVTYLNTGMVPRLPTAVLSTGLMIFAFLSFVAGIILQTVTKGRIEFKRLLYLSYPVPHEKK